MFQALFSWFDSINIDYSSSFFNDSLLKALDTFVISLIIFFVARIFIHKVLKKVITKTKTNKDDILFESNVFAYIPHLAPALVVINAIPLIFENNEDLSALAFRIVYAYIAILFLLTTNNLLTALEKMYRTIKSKIKLPITAFVQTARIIITLLGGLMIVAILMQKSPLVLLSGLGALTAIIMLIFKDSILGFVAGIQLTTNKMIHHGDWIEMPSFGADGEVMDITLTTVKVQNWDKTISMVPTYALVSKSFKNWQGMSESGSRRIKRSIFIDMQSITFCTEEMIKKFRNIDIIKEYIEDRQSEIETFNNSSNAGLQSIINGRHLTNIGTFRIYIEEYLKLNEHLHKNMTFIVRQLQPTAHGLPIEIYVFCNDIRWKSYEEIQSDIFDHILASVPEFGLKLFQNPSGADIDDLSKILKGNES